MWDGLGGTGNKYFARYPTGHRLYGSGRISNFDIQPIPFLIQKLVEYICPTGQQKSVKILSRIQLVFWPDVEYPALVVLQTGYSVSGQLTSIRLYIIRPGTELYRPDIRFVPFFDPINGCLNTFCPTVEDTDPCGVCSLELQLEYSRLGPSTAQNLNYFYEYSIDPDANFGGTPFPNLGGPEASLEAYRSQITRIRDP